MTEEELSRAAMTERYPDSNMSYDWLAWYKLRDVYREYKAGRITKAAGELQKEGIFRTRNDELRRYEAFKQAETHLAKFWIAVEEAGRNYMKEPTLEHADKFLEAVYGAGRLNRENTMLTIFKAMNEHGAETKSPSPTNSDGQKG